MYEFPLLKYAVNITNSTDDISFHYRGKIYKYLVDNPLVYQRFFENFNGRIKLKELLKQHHVNEIKVEEILQSITKIPLIIDGQYVLRDDFHLSGKEFFWRLEKFLIDWKKLYAISAFNFNLDKEIALGRVSENVVKGFCLELCHLLRNVPDELSLAVANAKNDYIRLHYMTFYNEESSHGEIIFRALKKWINAEDIVHASPLPGTTGLLNTYRYWASKDSLLYAVALMRDESSCLDAEILQEEDIYYGMKTHYNVPKQVTKVYEWHANLDRNNEHGFFPELIFSEYEFIDKFHARRLISALKQIIELHQQFRWNIYKFYSEHSIEKRFEAYKLVNFN